MKRFVAVLAAAVLMPAVAQAVTLTPISTPFNSPIGIDHYEPANKLVMTVHYPSGTPHNFELVAGDGSRVPFSTVSGLTDEIKIGSVRSGACQGGFIPGQLFTGNGRPGQVVRISANGSVVDNPWIVLPGESGLMRGSLFQDRYCVAGGDLIVVTSTGGVWRITSAGVATRLTNLSRHLEGLTTVPNDPRYGPWAGKIVAGAEDQGLVHTIDPGTGATASFNIGIPPEDFDIVPNGENFFGVNFGGSTLMGAPASEFCGMRGDMVVAEESPGRLWRVRWDGSFFTKELLATVAQWEHVTFSPAALKEIPAPPSATINDVTVTEGDSGTVDATFTVTLSRPPGGTCGEGAASVEFTTADGTAGAADYVTTSGTVNFGPTETTKTITVPVRGDLIDENDETFTVNLSNANGSTIADPQGVGTILDDDASPTISINDTSVLEGDGGKTPGTLFATLSGPSARTISARFATANGTAQAPGDYDTATGTITFAPGETGKSIVVQVNGDTVLEPDEVFHVDLSELVNVAPGDTRGTVTILDDERAGTFSCRASALRAPLLGEPTVANGRDVPCRDGFDETVRLTGLSALLSGTVRASVLNARTAQTPDDLTRPPTDDDGAAAASAAAQASITLPGLNIRAEVLASDATVDCVGGRPVLGGDARIARLWINNQRTTVGGPMDIGPVHINWVGRSGSSVTARAIWVDLGGANDIVVAESKANYEGNPCGRKREPVPPR